MIALIIEEERPCPSCGAKAGVSASFCPACGKPLPKKPTVKAAIDPEMTWGMTPMQLEVLRSRAARKAR